ncbi:MAG: hypothetical protein AB1560_09900 [Pseudomonadota bacterium]
MNSIIYKIALIVIVSSGQISVANTAIEYQKIINKQFPGFVILSPSDIDFSHADMSQSEIEKVRATAHLLLVNFNNDDVPDFVAKVRGTDKKTYPKSEHHPGYEYYSGGTVACISQRKREYRCEFLWETATFTLPERNYLVRIAKGTSMSCHHEDYMDPYSGKSGVTSFKLKTDAVGDLRMMGLGDSFFIPRPEGGFFRCTASD